ncbi:MAG: hypothetical protein ACRD0K_22795 [Egibacteraceae bacterium]
MASPKRFVPVNAVLALLREHDEWPPVLARAGFRLAGLEIPTTTPLGSTTLDMVCHRPADDYLLVAECKSGGNVDVEQARKLSRLDASGVSRTASVTLASGVRPRLEVLYVCLDEHAERIERALIGSKLVFPMLAIGPTHLGSLRTPCIQGCSNTARALKARPNPLSGFCVSQRKRTPGVERSSIKHFDDNRNRHGGRARRFQDSSICSPRRRSSSTIATRPTGKTDDPRIADAAFRLLHQLTPQDLHH